MVLFLRWSCVVSVKNIARVPQQLVILVHIQIVA